MFTRWISTLLVVTLASLPALVASGCGSGAADANNASNSNANSNGGNPATAEIFTDQQLDNLLAPVALYPDPLLAQMLPAATYPDDIEASAKYLRGNGDEDGINDQDWDISVKSISHYPKVVYSMADDPDWTATLGQAYVLQPADVMDSIQRLRFKAKESGALFSNDEQEIASEGEKIAIYPAQPQYMYVPEYDPNKVYDQETKSSGSSSLVKGLITFGAGVAVGVWLTRSFNWGNNNVYYNNWQGNDPWRVRTRNYYRWDDNYYRNSYYVNDRYSVISINRNIVYRPVRYDQVRVYDRIYPGISYRTVRVKDNPGIGDIMRRQYPGRPIEKGPPPGQLKKRDREIYGDGKDKIGKPGAGNGPGRGMDRGIRNPKGPADRGPSKMENSGGPAKSNDRGGPAKSNNKSGGSNKSGSPKGKRKP